ncbi:MAG: hypothetical protein FWC89_07670 [Defluviitaleaceae bacterium]|nr:hypothetical protein [Defluviitaleaceae bacterium]
MDKHKKSGDSDGLTGTLETANDWIRETEGTKVQNPNQNNQIHKQSLGSNARR